MEPEERVEVRCSKTNECNGRYLYPGKKEYQMCLQHEVHDLIKSGASQPRVVCVKADHCPLHIEGANCFPVKQ